LAFRVGSVQATEVAGEIRFRAKDQHVFSDCRGVEHRAIVYDFHWLVRARHKRSGQQ
jgi:hypothetical protein